MQQEARPKNLALGTELRLAWSMRPSNAIIVLERCITGLLGWHIKAYGAGLRSPGPAPMPKCLLGVSRDQFLQLRLGTLVREVSLAGPPICGRCGEVELEIGPVPLCSSDANCTLMTLQPRAETWPLSDPARRIPR